MTERLGCGNFECPHAIVVHKTTEDMRKGQGGRHLDDQLGKEDLAAVAALVSEAARRLVLHLRKEKRQGTAVG
eukprot:2964990-Pleurochrysis_carterae.AAC.2